jgi:hypothetical protein
MTTKEDTFNADNNNATGTVTLFWFNPSTNETIHIETVHNTLTYGAADALAAAYGGDLSYIPRYMGFAFVGTDYKPSTPSRDCTINTLDKEFVSENVRLGDIQVVNFSFAPTLSVDDTSIESISNLEQSYTRYENNAVTFHAHTVASGKYLFDSSSDFGDNKAIPFAVLLAKNNNGYKVLARVSLLDGNNNAKVRPEGFELALDWKVTFK